MASTKKAYNNLDFLNSPEARTIRMLCEYEEPRKRLEAEGIENTIVFFGSARSVSPEEAKEQLAAAEAAAEAQPNDSELQLALVKAQKGIRLSGFYDDARELARRLTEWDLARPQARGYTVSTGGGPGMMEAANRGASEVPGGRSVGLGISLPFEEKVNTYVPDELAFEFHYFFMRKLWFLYHVKAMVLMPGGFGTMDELFETLTLRQTGKIKKPVPTVLFGSSYWNDVIGMDAMIEWGTISPGDPNLMHVSDTVEDAFEYLTNSLEAIELED
jgi:uncharacterized protein (TIGR00730 family)